MATNVLHARRRALLQNLFTAERVRAHLLAREAWRPFPRVGERAGWEALPAEVRARVVERAEQHLGTAWPALPATLFLEFRRDGDRSRYEARHFARRGALLQLVLGECVEGKGRFLDDIVNGVWALCEESFWGVPAHSYSPRFPDTGLPDTAYRVVDLFAAETSALLAWTHYLLGERLAAELPVVSDRMVREVQERILVPYRTIDDWRWLGKARRPVNNWNPWIHSNVLAANLLLEGDPGVREATVLRVIEGLDAFLDGYHADGGCDEGTSYWGRAGASLFDCLELLWSASGGALDAFYLPLVQEIGRYIYRMHVGGPWFVNFADGAAKVALDGALVYRYGQRIGDPRMAALGAYAWRHAPERPAGGARGASIGRALRELFAYAELAGLGTAGASGGLPTAHRPPPTDPAPPLIRDAWLDGIQVLVARERAGTADGLFLAAKGGHNAESHNHNDVGHFVVALDGHPVLVDVGVETYTRRTFGPERYEIWTMQSQYHNLPAIDGYGQSAGREYAARDVAATIEDGVAQLTLDLAAAYPPAAGVRRWQRTLRLERGAPAAAPATGAAMVAGAPPPARVVLADDYELERAPRSLALHLMASGAVAAGRPGALLCATPTRPLAVRYDPDVFVPAVETIPIDDARLRPVWGDRLYRVILAVQNPSAQGSWRLTMAPVEPL